MAYADEYGRATGLLGRPAPGRAPAQAHPDFNSLGNSAYGLLTDAIKEMNPQRMAQRQLRAMDPGSDMLNIERLMNLFPAAELMGLGAVSGAAIPKNSLASGIVRRQPDAPTSPAPGTSMYDLPSGSKPEYLGAAPDRSKQTYLRYKPKNLPERTQKALASLRDPSNPIRQEMLADIRRGQAVGGSDWYNTEELRDWYIAELGPEVGHQRWDEYMKVMGAASPGSKVPANTANASGMINRASDPTIDRGSNMTRGERYLAGLDDVEKLDDAREVARGRTSGYGHKTQGLQELILARQRRGEWDGAPEPGVGAASGSWTRNPKPKGFYQSLVGNSRNIAADLHFTRYMAMASNDKDFLTTQAEVGKDVMEAILKRNPKMKKYFGTRKVDGKTLNTFNPKKAVKEGKAKIEDITMGPDGEPLPQMWAEMPRNAEYGAFEEFMSEIGQELGMTGPQVQANLWMGAADRTGVDPSSQGTFMELFRRRADLRAEKEGMTREQVVRRFIRDRGLLTPAVPVSPAMMPQPDDGSTRVGQKWDEA